MAVLPTPSFPSLYSLLHTPILSVRFRDLNDVCGILARDLDFDSERYYWQLALDNTIVSKPTHKTASLDRNRDRSCRLDSPSPQHYVLQPSG